MDCLMGSLGFPGYLVRVGWSGQGNDKDGTNGMSVLDVRLVAAPFYIEVQWEKLSIGCHCFHWICSSSGLFVPVENNNNNTQQINMSCNIVKYSTKSAYDISIL